jgi:hypothetical protein
MLELKAHIIDEIQTLSVLQLQELFLFMAFLKYKNTYNNANNEQEITINAISPLQQQLLLQREQAMKENTDKQMTWEVMQHKLAERYGE